MRNFNGRVILVGAGPGDAELISVKGLKALQKADVVLYDALVSETLLQETPALCKHIFVGKRKGKKEFSQEEINRLIAFYAQRFKNVVRLKGGDPYVFGRGHEELEFMQHHGIATEVIPGISSAIAAPSAAGIPLTKRHINESFWVITGILSNGELSNDLHFAAQSSATVVVLMGMSHLRRISEIFILARSPEEPICIIVNATMPEQKIIYSTVKEVFDDAESIGRLSPGVIVVGKVVNERRTLQTLMVQSDFMITNR